MGKADVVGIPVSCVGKRPPGVSAPHDAVFLRALRGHVHAVIHSVPGADEGSPVRIADDGPRFAPVNFLSVNPIGESLAVPVLAQRQDILLPEQKAGERFPPGEPEQLLPVAEDDRLGGGGIVGIQMTVREPVHVGVDAFACRNGGDDSPVAIKVQPDRPFHGAGVLLPGEAVGKPDGREPDVLSGRNDRGGAGGISGRTGVFQLVAGRAGK